MAIKKEDVLVNEKTLVELEKDGYTLKVVEEEFTFDFKVPRVVIDYDRKNQVGIRVDNEMIEGLDILRSGEYSKLELKVWALNKGLVSVEELSKLVADYNQAIEVVNYFKEELTKLENK